MEKDVTHDKYVTNILRQINPLQMDAFQSSSEDGLESSVAKYFPLMLGRYGIDGIKTPAVLTYSGNALDTACYGYVKPIKYIDAEGRTRFSYAVMIDEGEVFHSAASNSEFRLQEALGGLLGAVIRWSVHPPPKNYVPSIIQQFIEGSEDRFKISRNKEERKMTWTSYESREISYFFEWIGRHVFRSVYDPSLKLEHEMFTIDIKPALDKEKLEVLKRVDEGVKKVEAAYEKTDSSKTGFEEFASSVHESVGTILGEYGICANESDSPFDRELWKMLFINFPCWDYDIDDVLKDVDDHNVDLLMKNDWGFKSDKTPLQSYATSWPEFFQDLSEGKVAVTPEVAYDRLAKMAKKAVLQGLQHVREDMKSFEIGSWFDFTKSSHEIDMIHRFRDAERNESFLLENLPSVVRMPDKEIRAKFLNLPDSSNLALRK